MNIEQHEELINLFEDTVEYFCDTNHLSGEQVWYLVSVLSKIKNRQFEKSHDYQF